MIQCTITVLLAWFLVTSAAAQNAEDVDRLWQFEQPGIDKIARLTYAEHATILFSLGGEVVAYASAGRVQKLSCTTGDTACKVWDAALSHDGRFVAYIEAPVPDTSKNQRLVLQNIETGERRVVLEGMGRTSLSWSWDDSEIAYPEAPYSWGPQSAIYALSVHDGSTRVVTQLVKFIEERQRKGERIEDVSAPIQWAHGGERQVVGLTVQVPTGKPQESQPEFRIYIATQAGLSIFRTGWCPAVSPVADQVAYFDDNKVKLANLDGSQERVLTHAPRWLLFFSEDLARAITWSPDGKRLFFHVWISEDFRDKVYLLDVDSGRYAPFLKHTSVMILGWSQAPHSVNPEPLH